MNRMLRLLLSLLCAGVAAYAFGYLYMPHNPNNIFAQRFAIAGWAVPAHFFAGGCALLLTPLQLSTRLRERYPTFHRTSGLTYVGCVGTAGVAGLLLAVAAQGGLPARVGFATLALLWLATTTVAVVAVWQGQIERHRRWMLRSVALTTSAITLRLILGIGVLLPGLPFMAVYVFSAWGCWLVNLAVVEWLIARGMRLGLSHEPA